MVATRQPQGASSPYRPGNGLDPPYLGDREPQLARFRSFLAEPEVPHNVVVTGLRGVGKTVLLQRYSVEARQAGWLVAEREFPEPDAQPDIFAQRILNDLTRLTRELSLALRLKGVADAIAATVTDLLGTLSVSYEGVSIDYSLGRRERRPSTQMFDDDLREALLKVGQLCLRSDHPGFILRYDEFQVVREQPNWLTLSALLTAASSVQREGIPLLLVLCGLPSLLENLGRSKSYSERMFRVEEIGNLRPPENRLALVGPAEAKGRTFDPAATEAVLTETQGYPYFIQLYGDALWKGTGTAQLITLDDFARHRGEILDHLDASFFESRYLRASHRERRVLRAIGQTGESATSKEVRDRLGLKNNQLQPVLHSLVDKGLIYRPTRGSIAFTAPMFGAFMRRRHDDTE